MRSKKAVKNIITSLLQQLKKVSVNVNNKHYIGELTLFPVSGFEKFNPELWNKKLDICLFQAKKNNIHLKLNNNCIRRNRI